MLIPFDVNNVLEELSGFEDISEFETKQVAEGLSQLLYQVVENFDNKKPFYKDNPPPEGWASKLSHYEKALGDKLKDMLFTTHALFKSGHRGRYPRALLFDIKKTKKGAEAVWKTSLPSSLLIRTPQELRDDLARVLDLVEAVEGFSVWIGNMPDTFAFTANEPFIDVIYLLDAEGWSAIAIGTSKGISWLPIQGEAMDACLFAALMLNSGARYRGVNRVLLKELTTATVLSLSQPASIKPPLMDGGRALETARYLWEEAVAPKRAIDKFFVGIGQSTCSNLDNAIFALAELLDKSAQLARDAHREGEQNGLRQVKRLTKDLEKMTLGYKGLQARAARQEKEILSLRKQLSQSAQPTSAGVVEKCADLVLPQAQKSLGVAVMELLSTP